MDVRRFSFFLFLLLLGGKAVINYWPVIPPGADCAVHLRWITPVLPRLSPDSSMLCTLALEVLVQLWVLAFCAAVWKTQNTGVKVCREVGKSWLFCARKRMSCSFQTLHLSTWNLKPAFNWAAMFQWEGGCLVVTDDASHQEGSFPSELSFLCLTWKVP